MKRERSEQQMKRSDGPLWSVYLKFVGYVDLRGVKWQLVCED